MKTTMPTLTLHPHAQDFLFEYFEALNRIFSDALGQLEIAYLSIALINQNGEIFFLSSSPSVEYNLIEKKCWQDNGCYQANFIYQDQSKLWSELFSSEYRELSQPYKHYHELVEGVSIPCDYENYRSVFSFGFKKINFIHQHLPLGYQKKLLAIGKYCLKNIIQHGIPFPDKKRYFTKSQLTLVVSN